MFSEIFQTEPNLRITIEDLMEHKYFTSLDFYHQDFWAEIRKKKVKNVPFVPDTQPYKERFLKEDSDL
jgi:hypothetical protein